MVKSSDRLEPHFGICMEIGLGMDIAKTNLPHEAPEGAMGGGGVLSLIFNILGHAECQFQLSACGLSLPS